MSAPQINSLGCGSEELPAEPELKELLKEMSLLRHENRWLSQQNAALKEYLEKAHGQLEQFKQEKEEGKKMEDLKTQLAVKSAQVITYSSCMTYYLR